MNIAGEFRPYATATEASPDQARSLLLLRDFLRREWRLIAFITTAALALGAFYVGMAPRKFTAQADMFIDTKGITSPRSENSQEHQSADDSVVESEIETTRSEKVGKAVIAQLHLTDDPEFVSSSAAIMSRLARLLR